jgi:hypothetical protein
VALGIPLQVAHPHQPEPVQSPQHAVHQYVHNSQIHQIDIQDCLHRHQAHPQLHQLFQVSLQPQAHHHHQQVDTILSPSHWNVLSHQLLPVVQQAHQAHQAHILTVTVPHQKA